MIELIYCSCIFVLAIGLGLRLLRWLEVPFTSLAEEVSFSLGLGLGGVALGTMALGFFHLFYEASFYVLLLVCGAVGHKEIIGVVVRLKSRSRRFHLPVRTFYFWMTVLVLIGVLLNLPRALTPVHGPVDPLAYHLALPQLYLQKHYLSFEPTITGTLYPSNIAMLYSLALGLRGGELAQLMHFFMALSCLFFIVSFCRRYFDAKVGIWAMAFFSFTPVLVFFAPLGYIDVGVCFFVFLSVWALFNWLENPDDRSLALAAILTGFSLAAKHPSMPILFVGAALVLIALRLRGAAFSGMARGGLLFVGMALLVVSPWYVRSYVEADNPVWPLANGLFEGHPYKESFAADREVAPSASATVLPSIERLKEQAYWSAKSLWHWSWSVGDMQRGIGIYIVAFLPGLLLYARSRRILFLSGFCLVYYLIVVLFVDGNPRYSIFLFAYLCIVAGYVAEQMVRGNLRSLKPVLQVAICVTLLCNVARIYVVTYNSGSLDYLFSEKAKDQFLVEREGNYRVFRQVNFHLPQTAVVLLQGIVKGYYCQRPYLWDHPYQDVINYRYYNTPDKLLGRMRELGISHIVRMMHIPPMRTRLGYPQYFSENSMHEEFRKKYLKLLYRDESYVLFEVTYPTTQAQLPPTSPIQKRESKPQT